MANANNEPDFPYRIYLQEQLSMDLHSDAGSVLLDSPQREMITQIQGNRFIDIGIMSRESLMAWVYGVIKELESFELHKKIVGCEAWSQLYKIIKNHDIFKGWIYSRPKTDASGFVISLRDYTSHSYYSTATVLGYCRSVWQRIENDLKDENPTRFMKELFQQVFSLWHFKCCMKNLLRDRKGLPPTTPDDTFVELTSYITRDIVSNPNLPNSRLIPTPANIQIGGHSFNAANPVSSPNGAATANNQERGRQSTYASGNSHNSQIPAGVRGKQHTDTNTALGQIPLSKVKLEQNIDSNATSCHIRNISEINKRIAGYQAGSSLTKDAIQTTEPTAGGSEGRNIKQEVDDKHNHGQQAEESPKGWKQYMQQIIGVGNNQSVQAADQSSSGVPSKSTNNEGEIRKRSASVGSDIGAVPVPVHAKKKIKVEK